MREIYWYIVAITLIVAVFLPQYGENRKIYIILMAVLHAFVSAFRYKFLTGDLLKYNTEFQDLRSYGYFSERAIHEWKNTGFYWLMKFLADITGGNFQSLLIVISVTIEVVVAILIYRYSTRPWLSYLVWNCFGFYIFGFNAIKQALAMAVVMTASVYIFEEKPKKFLAASLLAGFIHFPAFVFLPAYWIAKSRLRSQTILGYIAAAAIIFVFNNSIVRFMTETYYDEDEIITSSNTVLGGRFFLMVLILICGILIKGFGDRNFEKLFNLMIVGAIFQMFSGYDNVFTRLADYYFQFSVLFLPLMFSSEETDVRLSSTNRTALFPFNERSLRILVVLMSIFLIWYYYTTNLSVTISYSVDDYLNYRFMWDVSQEDGGTAQ